MDNVTGDRYRSGEVPQIDEGWLDENTTHVTIGITGNDARFAEVLQACITADIDLLNPCTSASYYLEGDPEPLRIEQQKIIDAQLTGLQQFVNEVAALAPSARCRTSGLSACDRQPVVIALPEPPRVDDHVLRHPHRAPQWRDRRCRCDHRRVVRRPAVRVRNTRGSTRQR